MSQRRRILIATDAWKPQVNGVVRTLTTTVTLLRERGHVVELIEPHQFRHFPFPLYPEIHLSWPDDTLAARIDRFRPDHVHIATEGPVGLAVRAYCRARKWRFTTSYHTKFPEYLERMVWLPANWSYGYMRWFHRPAAAIMVATPSIESELRAHQFLNPIRRWSRGVDLSMFHPRPKSATGFDRPISLYVGRVSTEKNLQAFLELRLPGTQVIVGDGPERSNLMQKYPDARFLGALTGEELARTYADADVFVFPSKTDTFGLVILEALASGVPVAAYPVPGPIDILTRPEIGALDHRLSRAIELALQRGRPEVCVQHAAAYTWERCVRQFQDNLVLLTERVGAGCA